MSGTLLIVKTCALNFKNVAPPSIYYVPNGMKWDLSWSKLNNVTFGSKD